ncbi:MAG: penicillin-binding transpeptidase domain-containing protein [Actinomycetota bacterium]|nr:penicillin-binding transpeptidase domain-containing protein [Actinomycetota bacterium]
MTRSAPWARAVTAGVVLGLLPLSACSNTPAPDGAAKAFLADWTTGDYLAAAKRTDGTPEDVAQVLQDVDERLDVLEDKRSLGQIHTDDDTATAQYRAELTLRGLGNWSYTGSVPLRYVEDKWTVDWSPAVIHPKLGAHQRLTRTRQLPERANILDGDGRPLFAPTPVVNVGMVPGRLTDPAGTISTLERTTGADPDRLRAALAAAKPDQLVPVITLRETDYQEVKPQIHPIAGLVFARQTRQLPPTTDFARTLLGRVGPATAETLKKAGPAFQDGDELGSSGLQAAFQQRLAGMPSGAVVVADLVGGGAGETLHTFAGKPGEPVRTTLSRPVQLAAEAALDQVQVPAALVAVRPSTGELLAVANRPTDSSLNRALAGRYPPGSTFKVVTAAALLEGGLSPVDRVPCPPTVTVSGKSFRNFEGEAGGDLPFRRDFALSCNTAFVSLAARLDADALPEVARRFGLGADWSTPVPAYPGSVPQPADPVDEAAEMIGQGRVLASPLGMAMVAGTVSAGSWRPPVLVTEPAQQQSETGQQQSEPAQQPGETAQELAPGTVAALRDMMRAVVTEGTAAGTMSGLDAPPVAGKTGTAEFGTQSPPQTHAWFIGYRGDLAFAVLLEGGGVGGRDAAPVAADFLRTIDRQQ